MIPSSRLRTSPNTSLLPKCLSSSPKFRGRTAEKVLGRLVDDGAATLVVIDVLGMAVPRTIESYISRGSDDARETFLRENFGTLGNMFLMGGASLGLMRLAGRTINKFNPKGIPVQAFINAKTLDTFSDLYSYALETSATPKEVRSQFIDLVLGGLESTDRQSSLMSRLQGIQKLNRFPDEQKHLLQRTLVQIYGQKGAEPHFKKALDLVRSEDSQSLLQLKQQLLHPQDGSPGWGRLSHEARVKMREMYALTRDSGKKDGVAGTLPLDEMATDVQGRMSLSLKQLEGSTKNGKKQLSPVARVANLLDATAYQHGLTSTVNLKRDAVQSLAVGRKNMLIELKHFLEQFVDRATRDAKDHADWRKGIEKALYHQEKTTFPVRVFSSATEGLITVAQRSKLLYTGVPVALTLMASGILVFFNNWYTRHKYHGKVFFPGEGVPKDNQHASRKQSGQTQPFRKLVSSQTFPGNFCPQSVPFSNAGNLPVPPQVLNPFLSRSHDGYVPEGRHQISYNALSPMGSQERTPL